MLSMRSISRFFLIALAPAAAQSQPMVAAPTATPRGNLFSVAPHVVSLATATPGAAIFYTLDGSVPSVSASVTTKAYTGPLNLAATVTLKAISVKADMIASAVITENYTWYVPIQVSRAWFRDGDGDGRIESARVVFSADLAAAPERLRFAITTSAAAATERFASRAEIKFAPGSKSIFEVDFAEPFPFGVTSVPNYATAGGTYLQENIPLLAAAFEVQDSVPPVIAWARIGPADFGLRKIEFAVSEPVRELSGAFGGLLTKRDGEAPRALVFAKLEKLSETRYAGWLDTAAAANIAAGDSLGFTPGDYVADTWSNHPLRAVFIAIDSHLSARRATGQAHAEAKRRWKSRVWSAENGKGARVDAKGARRALPTQP